MYNDLLEKHQALAASKGALDGENSPVSGMAVSLPGSMPTYKQNDGKSSLQSLTAVQATSFQQQNQLNPRIIRYLNNKQQFQMDNNKRDLSNPANASNKPNIMVYP